MWRKEKKLHEINPRLTLGQKNKGNNRNRMSTLIPILSGTGRSLNRKDTPDTSLDNQHLQEVSLCLVTSPVIRYVFFNIHRLLNAFFNCIFLICVRVYGYVCIVFCIYMCIDVYTHIVLLGSYKKIFNNIIAIDKNGITPL